MKNREKYTNTEDALKAYEAHKKECKCDCTFDNWLDADEDAAKKAVSRIAGLLAGALVAPLIIGDILKDDNEEHPTPSKPSDDAVGDIGKCPVCGSDMVKLHRDMLTHIECPDCGLFFGVNTRNFNKKEHDEKLLANWRKLQENVKNK